MEKLKLSAPDWCFFPPGGDPAVYYRQLKEMGYDGAEMVAPERWRAAQDAGLNIVNLSGPGMAEGMNRRENRRKLSDEILRLAGEAAAAGIPWIIVFSGNKGNLSDEKGLNNCLEGYAALLERLRGSGVGLLFEMLNKSDHADYQADSENFGFRLVRQLDDPDFRLLYDVYHMVRSGCDPFRDLAEKLPWIGHFHVAALEGRRFPEPAGAIDYRSFLRAIPEGEFHGYVGMEFLPADAAHPEPELRRAAELFHGYAG